jgi:hypothetical protein
MSTDNIVDLKQHFSLDNRARGFFTSIKAIHAVLEVIGNVVTMLDKADQRFLCQILAWRLEGAPYLPATEGLVHMPLLTGMGFAQIQACAERLVVAGIIENIALKQDKQGNVLEMAFRWPQLDTLLEQGKEIAAGPQMIGLDGRPLGK